MSSKKRKESQSWFVCENCKIIIVHKSLKIHNQNSCPPNYEEWIHPFLLNDTLYSNIDIYSNIAEKSLQFLPKECINDFVLVPYQVLQLWKIPIGSPVVIKVQVNSNTIFFVKTAWPLQEKIPDMTLHLSKEVCLLYRLNEKCRAVAFRLKENLPVAKRILVSCLEDKNTVFENVFPRLGMQNIGKIFCIGNKIMMKKYGLKICFQIIDIVPFEENENLKEISFYTTVRETKWMLNHFNIEEKSKKPLIEKLGGLSTLIEELKDVISLGLSNKDILHGLNVSKGILIHGPLGTGKTTLIEGLSELFTNNIIKIECSKIFSKVLGETEQELRNHFQKAEQLTPSIILLDDLDVLCGKSNFTSEFEKRIIGTLSLLMDKLNKTPKIPIMVLATTSNIHQVDKTLRSPSRFGKEVEIYVPNKFQRLEIINLLLSDLDHNLSQDDLKNLADSCHGYVGADLSSLVSKALLRNYRTSKGEKKVSYEEFEWALSKVRPSAMKEIMIEIPNVKWEDIGGQDDLKLKLKQCIEWPLKYGESFEKLGITPPKGVLMFGPPGCSKTMIAKALATESKLNFISVKGPELFSKWVGESERAVRKVFKRARQAAPSIIFFDELDAIGGERNLSSSGSNVQERVLAQLLTELDGVEPLDNVTVVAATNRIDRIDPALLRPGRLDRIIYVPLPDEKTRKEILNIQLKKTCITKSVSVDEIVRFTEGYSGAEIIAVCQEAALFALEESLEAEAVTRRHFLMALTRVLPRTPKTLLDLYKNF